ncbi:MAG: hypothetical protein JXD21_01975 [Candidatus Omnitrophica bacterium]|nr:hypothetical protein [Candidatus Omnitrophota bacterium]
MKSFFVVIFLLFTGCTLLQLPGKAIDTVGKAVTTTGKMVESTAKIAHTAGKVVTSPVAQKGVIPGGVLK